MSNEHDGKTEFFDLGQLACMLSMNLDPTTHGEISLGEYHDRTHSLVSRYVHSKVRPLPLFNILCTDRLVDSIGFYKLDADNGVLEGAKGILWGESDKDMGFIAVETGSTDKNSGDSGTYEAIKLRTKGIWRFRDGTRIGNVSIKITCSQEEVGPREKERKDYFSHKGIWVSANYSRVIPTEWFLRYR